MRHRCVIVCVARLLCLNSTICRLFLANRATAHNKTFLGSYAKTAILLHLHLGHTSLNTSLPPSPSTRPNEAISTCQLRRHRSRPHLLSIWISHHSPHRQPAYPLATHVAAAANSTAGAVSGLLLGKNIDAVLTDLIQFNPHFHILDARRLGYSTFTQVTFCGDWRPTNVGKNILNDGAECLKSKR